MHDLYNEEIYNRSRCEDLMKEADLQRMLNKIPEKSAIRRNIKQNSGVYIRVIIDEMADDREMIMVEVR